MKKIVCAAVLALVSMTAQAGSGDKDKEREHTHVGEPVPPGLKIGGKPISALQGKPVLLHIWATWCGPCKESLPAFHAIGNAYAKTDLQVIMLDRDDNNAAAHMYLAQLGITWPDYHDNGGFFKTFGGHGIPATVLIDRDGIVRYHHTGEGLKEKSVAKLQRAIERALRTPVTPPGGTVDKGEDESVGQ